MGETDKNKIEDKITNTLKEFGEEVKSTNPIFQYIISKGISETEYETTDGVTRIGILLFCDISSKEPIFKIPSKKKFFSETLSIKEPILKIIYGFRKKEEKNFLYIRYSNNIHFPEIRKFVDSYLKKYSKLLENNTRIYTYKFKKHYY